MGQNATAWQTFDLTVRPLSWVRGEKWSTMGCGPFTQSQPSTIYLWTANTDKKMKRTNSVLPCMKESTLEVALLYKQYGLYRKMLQIKVVQN